MPIVCSACGGLIREEDISPELNVARCSYCSALTDLRAARPAPREREPEPTASRPAPAVRLKVPMPPGLFVDEWGQDLVITRRWFSGVVVFLAFFCIAWDSFLVGWYMIAFGEEGPPGPMRFIMVCFPIVHVAVGVALTYSTIAGFVNRTIVRISQGTLTVEHGPLPWTGNVSVAAADVDQVYCTEKAGRRGERSSAASTYIVNAVLKDGRSVKLVSVSLERKQALYIEQKLEEKLGIADQPVSGEIER